MRRRLPAFEAPLHGLVQHAGPTTGALAAKESPVVAMVVMAMAVAVQRMSLMQWCYQLICWLLVWTGAHPHTTAAGGLQGGACSG